MKNIEIIETSSTSERCCFNDANCHKLSLNRKTGLVKLDDLTLTQLELLKYRSDLQPMINSEVICLHHYKYFIDKYSQFQKFCCDPFQKHLVYLKTNLLVLELDNVKSIKR